MRRDKSKAGVTAITGTMSRAVAQVVGELAVRARSGEDVGLICLTLDAHGKLTMRVAGKFDRDRMKAKGALVDALRGIGVE